MKLIKRWQLNKTTVDEADVLWLRKYSRKLDVKNDVREFETHGKTFQYHNKMDIFVQTETREQENMLQLKYGNLLFLMTQTWIAPGQVLQDHYGTITFD
jgi:hypothetical protein